MDNCPKENSQEGTDTYRPASTGEDAAEAEGGGSAFFDGGDDGSGGDIEKEAGADVATGGAEDAQANDIAKEFVDWGSPSVVVDGKH